MGRTLVAEWVHFLKLLGLARAPWGVILVLLRVMGGVIFESRGALGHPLGALGGPGAGLVGPWGCLGSSWGRFGGLRGCLGEPFGAIWGPFFYDFGVKNKCCFRLRFGTVFFYGLGVDLGVKFVQFWCPKVINM